MPKPRSDKVFIPLTDDLVFDSPEQIAGMIVPYAPGMVCGGWLEVEINPEDDDASAAEEPELNTDGLELVSSE